MRENTRIILISVLFFFANQLHSSCPDSLWSKLYGGQDEDCGHSICSSINGYILAGWTWSMGAGEYDCYVISIDFSGAVLWEKTFGGDGYDDAYSVIRTGAGDYALCGMTDSYGAGGKDVWFVRFDSLGNLENELVFGDSGNDGAYSIINTGERSYLLTGYTESGGSGSQDILILNINEENDSTWIKTCGGSEFDVGRAACRAGDDSYLIVGESESFGLDSRDIYVVKINSEGVIQWEKTFGGDNQEWCYDIENTADGDFLVVGATRSYGSGDYDVYIVKLDMEGNVVWDRTIGGEGIDCGYSVEGVGDGCFVITGKTKNPIDMDFDLYMLKIDSNGNLMWSRTIGDLNNEAGFDTEVPENKRLLAIGNKGQDVFLVCMQLGGAIREENESSIQPVECINSRFIYCGRVNLEFRINVNEHTGIYIFDSTGRIVKQLYEGFPDGDIIEVEWSGINTSMNVVSDGVYFVGIEYRGMIQLNKIVFFR